MMKITIVIPTYNRRGHLKKTLESIAGQTYDHSEFEVIIVDDFSIDGTKEMVSDFSKKADFTIRYINNDIKGQTMARNKGFKLAKLEIVVSTDSDIEADPKWLINGIKYFNDKEVAAVEGRIVSEKNIEPFYHALANENGGTYQTANMFYRQEALEMAGYLDEKLNQWWNFGSDYDLALRVMEKGAKIIFARDAVIYHPVCKLRVKAMLKNALKSQAIPYLYRKHKSGLPHHLKMNFYRALGGLFLFVFLASVFFSWLAMLVSLAGILFSTVKCIQGFKLVSPKVKLKALGIYSLGSGINFLAFLYSCWRFRVLPSKRIFRL